MIKTKKKDKSILFLLLIFLATISISIGYCKVNDVTLKIEGVATAEPQKILYIDNIEIGDATTTGGSYGAYSAQSTLLQITSLTLPTENVTEDTNVTVLVNLNNLSDLTYEFTGISYLTEDDLIDFPAFSVANSNSNIKIDESSYKDLLETVIDGASIDGIGTMTIPIRFKYVDINNITDNTLNISIKLNFREIERQNYILKTGKNFYDEISSHYSDATSILFCSKPEVPQGATSIGDVGLTEGEIKAYWNDGTIYIAAETKNSIITFNEDSGYMFSNGDAEQAFSKVKSIGISKGVTIDTSNVTQFEEMFKGCSNLTDDGIQGFLNRFDTSNAVNMCAMFGNTTSLTNIDLSGFDTSNVTDMSWMFENDTGLINITFGDKFVTSAVTGTKENQGLAAMFTNCSSLKVLDLTNFDTSKAKSMWFMFSECSSLEKIYASDKFVTTNLITWDNYSQYNLFRNCTKLKGDNGTEFSSSNVDASYAHIDGGTDNPGYFSSTAEVSVKLDANGGVFGDGATVKEYTGKNKLVLSLNENPIKEGSFFIGWSNKADATTSIYQGNSINVFMEDTVLYAVWREKASYTLATGTNIYNKIGAYRETTEHIKFTFEDNVPEDSILIGNVDSDDGGNIKAYYNEKVQTVYIASPNSSTIIEFNEDSSHMFSNGSKETTAFNKVKTIEVDDQIDIYTNKVRSFAEIFKYNTSLTQDSLQAFINKFDTSSVTNMCAMFEYLSFDTIDVSNFNTDKVTDMSWMFHGGSYSNIIFGDNFNTENVTNFDGMFQELSQMINLDISIIKIKKKATINYMFGKCPNLKRIYVSEDNGFENASTGMRVFENCTSLVGGSGDNETQYTSSEVSKTYARISTADNPGYFTNVTEKEE